MAIALLLSVCCLYCCKKEKKTSNATEITYAGVPCAYFPLMFSCSAPTASSYSWNFGDSTGFISLPEVKHTYIHSGSFTITLYINNDQSHPVSKTIYIYPFLDFTFNQRLFGQPVNFKSSIPGSTYLWNFGDNSTSADTSPNHIYSATGNYKVTMTLNNDTLHVVNHTIEIVNDPVYTHLIAGMKLWHHVYTIDYTQTTYPKPDTSFSVTYIDPLTISIGADTLNYSSTYSDSTLRFFRTVNHDIWHEVTSIPTFKKIIL